MKRYRSILSVLLVTSAPAIAQVVWSSSPAPSNLTQGSLVEISGRLLSAGADTWTWTSAGWTLLSIPTSAGTISELVWNGSRAVGFGARFDPVSQRTELAASEFDPTFAKWTLWPDQDLPVGQILHAFHDPIRNVHVVVETDGSSPLRTWTFHGTWTQASGPAPSARRSLAIAFDEARQRAVLYGGLDPTGTGMLSDTWEWDGTAWQQRAPALSPGPRAPVDLVFHAARKRVVMIGGSSPTHPDTDVYEWDGTDWRLTPTIGPAPTPGHFSDLEYVKDGDRIVLASFDPVTHTNTTWTLASQFPATRPAFDFGCGLTVYSAIWDRPWIGDAWPLRTGGVTRSVVMAIGASRTQWGSIPLPMSLPNSLFCELRVSPDVLMPVPRLIGMEFSTTIPIPPAPALVGATVFGQFLGLGDFGAVTASEGMSITIGRR